MFSPCFEAQIFKEFDKLKEVLPAGGSASFWEQIFAKNMQKFTGLRNKTLV